eukprot:CAMPEP_0183720116 /NCGR_PEP_ID=MMETSP0737-20130205/12820_1 /TAXON_ID=385413 /ORGANISM="Thalassiosira miniscula, Strain CCMP1093" /LENGTH=573 /DNA_ID=CAMNT_0025949931 /DNA_START=92 /DNA_END=1813 /DNA_ORIENTATION=+
MVNGAPDDIVSWVPSGEAFRISDLSRLESETLPQYFRHSRFQSLVRQLNFYNFRKINRERTFWVYYHPLFHRDRPEEMHKLRRRTCPGFDGRRNRPNQSVSPPPPSASITYEATCQDNSTETSKEESAPTTLGMVTSPGMRMKVSRSPSPSNSPMDHPPAGRGSFRSLASLKLVVSEEEKSPGAFRRPDLLPSYVSSSSQDNSVMEGQKAYYRTESEDAEMNVYYEGISSSKTPADPLQEKELSVVDQLSYHLDAPNNNGYTTFTKKSRKAKIWPDDNDDDSSSTHPSGRKKYSKLELQERQDHLLAVEDVSRRLNGICADYAASIAACKPRSNRGKGRGRLGVGAANGQPGVRSASPAFGLDKPHDHYYGVGKCDLFTYDCDDGFFIDEQYDGDINKTEKKKKKKKKNAVDSPPSPCKPSEREEDAREVITAPPCQCPLVNQSLVQACMEGKLLRGASILERTLASAVLSFCLATHPRDPLLAQKITDFLKKGPMLAQEFGMYCNAMAPGMYADAGRPLCASDEYVKRDWKMFSLNFIKPVAMAHVEYEQLLTPPEKEALHRCVASWKFQEI